MPRAAKYTEVMAVIERRIRQGDYLLDVVPGERTIAAETGVSHMTARKAVQALITKRVLKRAASGGLQVNPHFQSTQRVAQIVMLYPAYPSPFLTQLRQTILNSTRQHGLELRPVQYVHWDDPVVMDAVGNPGGTIVIPSSSDVPERVVNAMRAGKCISMDIDLSHHGIKSIRIFPDAHIFEVFDHLKSLGHKKINCISTHTSNAEVKRRIKLWRDWLKLEGLEGELWESPAPSFDDPTPYAHQLMLNQIDQQDLSEAAVVGTTFPAALGAARACWEQGMTVGKDISICSMNIESPARFMTPGIAGLDIPELSSLLERCFGWFLRDEAWDSPTLLEPTQSSMFRGESIDLVP